MVAIVLAFASSSVSIVGAAQVLPSFPCSPSYEQRYVFFNVTRYETNKTSNRLSLEFTNTYLNYTTRCVGYRNPDGWTDWQPCENQAVPTYFKRRDQFNSHEDLILNQTWSCSDNPVSNANNAGPPRIVTATGQSNIDMCMPLDYQNHPGYYFSCYASNTFTPQLQHRAPPPPACPAAGASAAWSIPNFTFESRKQIRNGIPWDLPEPPHNDLVFFNARSQYNGWEGRCFGGVVGRPGDSPLFRNDVFIECPSWDETVDKRAFPDRSYKYDHFGARVFQMNEVAKCVDGKGQKFNLTSYGTITLGKDTLKCTTPDPADAEEKWSCGPISFDVKGSVTSLIPAKWESWT